MLIAISFQRRPLLEEEILIKLLGFYRIAQLFSFGGKSVRVALGQFRLPGIPGRSTVSVLHRRKERIALQPRRRPLAKSIEIVPQICVVHLSVSFERLPQYRIFKLDHKAVIDPLDWKMGGVFEILLR